MLTGEAKASQAYIANVKNKKTIKINSLKFSTNFPTIPFGDRRH